MGQHPRRWLGPLIGKSIASRPSLPAPVPAPGIPLRHTHALPGSLAVAWWRSTSMAGAADSPMQLSHCGERVDAPITPCNGSLLIHSMDCSDSAKAGGTPPAIPSSWRTPPSFEARGSRNAISPSRPHSGVTTAEGRRSEDGGVDVDCDLARPIHQDITNQGTRCRDPGSCTGTVCVPLPIAGFGSCAASLRATASGPLVSGSAGGFAFASSKPEHRREVAKHAPPPIADVRLAHAGEAFEKPDRRRVIERLARHPSTCSPR